MINLIPQREKNIIWMEKMNKLVLIHWLLIFFFLSCFILILFSIKIYFKSQAEANVSEIRSPEIAAELEKVENFKKSVFVINLNLTEQNKYFSQKINFSIILERIANLLPKNISLESVSMEISENAEDVDVNISGFAASRNDLVSLKENLEKEKTISEVSFPPSNWVKASNIDFVNSFKISKKNERQSD